MWKLLPESRKIICPTRQFIAGAFLVNLFSPSNGKNSIILPRRSCKNWMCILVYQKCGIPINYLFSLLVRQGCCEDTFLRSNSSVKILGSFSPSIQKRIEDECKRKYDKILYIILYYTMSFVIYSSRSRTAPSVPSHP